MREEVTAAYEAVRARGDEDITPGDIDNLRFTNAVIKVVQPPPPKPKNVNSDGLIGNSETPRVCH